MASTLKNLSDYKKTILKLNNPRIVILVSEWNEQITDVLAQGAIQLLEEHQLTTKNYQVHYVPGTFELSTAASLFIKKQKPDAVICLGCVIQGETRHFDFICNASANAIAQLGTKTATPVIFGVLTTDNLEQALDRAGGKHGNKGTEAAITALKMISLANILNRT